MKSRFRQQGLSPLSVLLVMMAGAFAIVCAIKLIPVYLEGGTVADAVESAIESDDFASMSTGEMKKKIGKYFEINRVDAIASRDIVIKRNKGITTIDASFEKRLPLLFNIDVVVKFENLVYEFKSG